jgi:hypothetical protein
MASKTSRPQLIIAVIVVAAIVLGFFWLRRHQGEPVPLETPSPTATQKPGIDTSNAVAVGASAIDPANDGKQISVSGDLIAGTPATDSQLGIVAPDAIMLLRFVEMLQWQQHCSGTQCTYQQVWSPQLINSTKFREAAGHENPPRLPMTTARFSSKDVQLGAFKIDAVTLGNYRLDASLRIKPTPFKVTSAQLPSNLALTFRDFNGALYAGDPEHRKVGDVRVSYRIIPASKVTVVGIQRGDKLIVQKSAAPGAEPMLVQPPVQSAAKGGG